ncbi:hypothetical protein TWF694_005475 [Orbilia ellipsospora]|uniref:Uncharacterized protein n=1 Tax=Orbilia ellipsospora TaxID=2528407 RepID=A0AAV9WUI9_9PEZI
MRFLAYFLAVAASLINLSLAIITGISVPATIKPGDGFNLYINTDDSTFSAYNVALAVGIGPGSGLPGALIQVTDSFYLGPGQYYTTPRISRWTSIPTTTPKGKATYTATLFALYGSVYYPQLRTWNATITVGDSTSATYVTVTKYVASP